MVNGSVHPQNLSSNSEWRRLTHCQRVSAALTRTLSAALHSSRGLWGGFRPVSRCTFRYTLVRFKGPMRDAPRGPLQSRLHFSQSPSHGRWLDWMRTPWQRSTSIQIVEDPHPIRLCHNPIFPSARCIYPRTGGSPVSPVLRRRGSYCKHVPVRFPSRLNLRQPADWGSPEVER